MKSLSVVLVDQVGEVSAGKSGSHGRYRLDVEIGSRSDIGEVHLEDGRSAFAIRPVDQDLTIEAPGSH